MYNLTELRQETDEIIENLLADGSDPEALYHRTPRGSRRF